MRRHCGAQRVQVGGQAVKRSRLQSGGAHAQAQLRRKTGGNNLAGAVGQRFQQRGLPALRQAAPVGLGFIASARRAEQVTQLRQCGLVQQFEPLGIKRPWEQ